MDIFLCGMLTACSWVAAAVFLRYWRQTQDRFFLFFVFAFVVFGFSRVPRAFLDPESPLAIYPFTVRLLGYVSILVAIVDKNLQRSDAPSSQIDSKQD